MILPFHTMLDLIFPKICIACEQSLLASEQVICIACQSKLPYAAYNTIVKLLLNLDHLPIENAVCFLIFQKENITQQLLHALKYQNRKDAGKMLGNMWARSLQQQAWIADIDGICPIPLHKHKEQKRGYNQSLLIAESISHTLDIPILKTCISRTFANETQTRKSDVERILNVKNVFAVKKDELVASLQHLLIIDDVITTGATLSSAANSVKAAYPHIKVSIGALALAQ